MGKKRVRSSKASRGERSSISPSIVKLVRRQRSAATKLLHKMDAWRRGKNPWITIPDPSERMRTKEGPVKALPLIRVRANSIYGDPRHTGNSNIYRGRPE